MQFTSTVSLTPFDEYGCDVEAIYLPGDPSVGIADEWDIFVSINGVDVTYDILFRTFSFAFIYDDARDLDHINPIQFERFRVTNKYLVTILDGVSE